LFGGGQSVKIIAFSPLDLATLRHSIEPLIIGIFPRNASEICLKRQQLPSIAGWGGRSVKGITVVPFFQIQNSGGYLS
jgi:hypothetical protein